MKCAKVVLGIAFCALLIAAGCKEPVDDIDPQQDLLREQSTSFNDGIALGTIGFDDLDEASGLANSRSNPDFFWSHNDSGGDPLFYLITVLGADSGRYQLDGVENFDWEDMAIGVGPDDNTNYLYAADIGDNFARRESLTIYRVPEPDVTIRFRTVGTNQVQIDLPADTTLGNVEAINFVYEDGARDAESLFVDPSTKDIYIVSKREASVILYTLPFPQNTVDMDTAERVSVLPFTQITAADISPNGNEILIKNYQNIYYWAKSGNESLAELLAQEPQRLRYTPEPQGEAIAWASDGRDFYTLSESGNGEPVVLYNYQRN